MTQPAEITTRRLDHLPIVGQALSRLGIRKIVDDCCPPDPRNEVTVGECVEALVATILLGSHTLYRVDEQLAPFDLKLAFGWTAEAERFNDDRLGSAMEQLFDGGIDTAVSGVVVNAIKEYRVDLSRFHFDTSSAKVHGEYASSKEPSDPEAPSAIPHVTLGHSKDYRPDLKQILFGLTVTGDGAVPICGRVASGNRTDSEENRFNIRQLAKVLLPVLPDLSKSVLVADCKFFAGETLLLAREHRLDYVTLLPRTVGLWEEVVTQLLARKAAGEELPKLKERRSITGELEDSWRGRSDLGDFIYRWKDKADVEHSFPVRLLAIESTALRDKKAITLAKKRTAERARLDRLNAALAKKEFASSAKARKAAEDALGEVRFHKVDFVVAEEFEPAKRPRRGRPRKGDPAVLELVCRIQLVICEDAAGFASLVERESCFVLATSLLASKDSKQKTDSEVFHLYREQHTIEGCMKWAKGPLEVAPIFLKTPKRIAALGAIYVLALMVYALIQRQVRAVLREGTTTIPGNNKSFTASPTTEVVFRLFEAIFTVRAPGESTVTVTNLTTEQVRVLRLLGNDVLARPDVVVATPRVPAPGQRGHRAHRD